MANAAHTPRVITAKLAALQTAMATAAHLRAFLAQGIEDRYQKVFVNRVFSVHDWIVRVSDAPATKTETTSLPLGAVMIRIALLCLAADRIAEQRLRGVIISVPALLPYAGLMHGRLLAFVTFPSRCPPDLHHHLMVDSIYGREKHLTGLQSNTDSVVLETLGASQHTPEVRQEFNDKHIAAT
ncbi:hypothetical protein DFH11DRAFT_1540808 [Phellopilus nigrolimitatus]|nr:hypothetical protein DFH11DRAFT_1540808 [Phellopilus nigrolimitatus]